MAGSKARQAGCCPRSSTLRVAGKFVIGLLIFLLGTSLAAAQVGDVTGVHDPSVIQAGNTVYLFATGRGITERTSTDLFHWRRAARVLTQATDWSRDYIADGGSRWAPDISFSDGEYRMYYAVSAIFGRTESAIGLCVNKTLDANSPDYQWTDRGKVISTPLQSNWNAIDPCAFEDAEGNHWMVLGSCWSGLKLVGLDRKTGLLADPNVPPMAVASNPPTNILEEGYIRRHGSFYYLWESVDHCCRGADSNYRILVGRARDVHGPYLDRDKKPMLRGGGTLVLASYDNVRGPGSCAILHFADRDFLIHHEYDAANHGTPTLQIRQLFWADDDWPVAGEPIARSPLEKPPTPRPFPGDWLIRTDFGPAQRVVMQDNGKFGIAGKWALNGPNLTMTLNKESGERFQKCILSDDASYFVGRDENGAVMTAVRAAGG